MTVRTVAIVGPGAIGLALAASLDRAGQRVHLCGRRAATGFDHTFGETTEHHDVPVIADPDLATPADLVLLCTKAHQTAGARRWLERLASPAAVLAVVQNGVDHEARVADLWTGAVLPVIISMPSARTSPTAVRQRRVGAMIVPEGPSGEAFAALFDDRVEVRLTRDWTTEAWTKLLTNSALGACAVLGLDNGALLEPPLRQLGEAMMREIVAVGRAEGAAFGDADALIAATMAKIGKTPEHASSITVDRRAGRQMEWDARNQVVVRAAERHGIDVPVSRTVAALLEAADSGAT